MKDLISVIIPIYDAGKYLEKCIESILSQTYENLELILIDDGSRDDSGKICDAYAEKDKRVKVIHKKNGGVSAARNTGIENAKGEFIAFVDSDDWIEKNSIEMLYNEIIHENACMSAGKFVRITPKGYVWTPFKERIYSGNEIAEGIVELIVFLCGPVVAKLFRRDIIVNRNLLFNSDIPMGEDSVFLMQYIQCCKKIVLKDVLVYVYNCMVPNSATHKFYQNYDYYYACACDAAKGVVEKSTMDDCAKQQLSHGLANRYCCLSVNYYLMNCFANGALKQKLREIIEKYEVSTEIECFFASGTKLFSYDEFVLLAEKNIDEFLKLYRRNLLRSSPMRYIKHRLRPVIKKPKIIR